MTPHQEGLFTPAVFRQWQQRALWTGAILSVLCIVFGLAQPTEFFLAYLTAYLFWFGLTLGPLALLMLQYLSGGAWGIVIRRPLESATRTLPLMALLFVPIAVGIPYLYHWSHPDLVQADTILRHRSVYMNTAFFIARAVAYFAIWMLLAYFLNTWSRREDEGQPQQSRFATLSAPGLIIYVFTLTFASIDWAESLQDHWYSTMWGFLFLASQGITATCLAILSLTLLARQGPLQPSITPKHFHDLGKILLTFVMLWAYFAFSQLVIVWSGNLEHEITWFIPRIATSWGWVGGALIVFQFIVPFLMLLSRSLKRNPVALSWVVGLLLLMRSVDMLWVTSPSLNETGFHLHWLTIVLPIAMGGLWIATYLHELAREPVLPLHTPGLQEALQHGRH
jgi:hypothetical protein